MTVIDFSAQRVAREAPDAQFITTDQFGRVMFCFFAEYQIDGAVFGLTFFAYDQDDALRRVEAVKDGLELRGQIMSEI